MELIKENDFAKAEFDADNSIIYSKYSGKVNVEKAIEILEAQLAFGKKNNVKAIQADLSELKGTFTMINDWLEVNFFPVLIEKGMKCHTLIVSKDVFSKFAIDDLVKRIGNFEMKTYDNFKEGQDWILEKLK